MLESANEKPECTINRVKENREMQGTKQNQNIYLGYPRK